MNAKKFKLALAMSVLLSVATGCTDDKPSQEGQETTDVSETITVEDAEQRVREAVSLEGQELRSTLLINSEDALSSLQKIAPKAVAQRAQVGDFFIVFAETQVIYRPSTDQIIQTVPILKADVDTNTQPPESVSKSETTQ